MPSGDGAAPDAPNPPDHPNPPNHPNPPDHPNHPKLQAALRPATLIAVAAAYLVLTLVLTWPAVARFSTDLIGDGGDSRQFAWNLWWVKRALVDLHVSPFFTGAIHHPNGVTLWLHTLTPFNGVASIPLQAVFSLVTTYNIIVVLSFVLSGLGAFLLARELGASTSGAFVGGFVFTFSSYHFAHALGHLNLVACEWLPFFALYLVRTLRGQGWKSGVLAGVFFALNAYCDSYYMVYAVLLGILLVMTQPGMLARHRAVLVGLASAAATVLVLVGPYLLAMARAAGAQKFLGNHKPEIFSADLTSYVVPNSVSSWGRFTSSVWSRWPGNNTENACFAGYCVLALAIFAVVRMRESRRWLGIALLFVLLSLGPILQVNGNPQPIPLLYGTLNRYVPYFNIMGVPGRMDVVVEMCLGVLVAHALTRLAWRPAVVAGVVALIAIERLVLPYPTAHVDAPVPRFYAALAGDPGRFGILDVAANQTVPMYFATIHRKPIVAGMVARLPEAQQRFIDWTPGLPMLLYDRPPPAGAEVNVDIGQELCHRLDVRYVITHDAKRREQVRDVLRLPMVEDRDGITVFNCAKEPTAPVP
jgi:hypothetical protein